MDYVELAIQSGGFMAMDRVLLTNRLALLETEMDKLAYIMPPASVINAYFAEIYQKQGPEAALTYFLDLSVKFKSFASHPHFDMEGSQAAPTFRFIRLNLSGQSFGLAFENAAGKAHIFSETPDLSLTDDLLLEIAQLFPDYIVVLAHGGITLTQLAVGSFDAPINLDALTTQAENEHYIKISAFNSSDGLNYYQKMINNSVNNIKMVQFSHRAFHFYFEKVGSTCK